VGKGLLKHESPESPFVKLDPHPTYCGESSGKSGGADFTKKSASQRELREILAQRLNKQPKKILNH
jgi:hypothetical protein